MSTGKSNGPSRDQGRTPISGEEQVSSDTSEQLTLPFHEVDPGPSSLPMATTTSLEESYFLDYSSLSPTWPPPDPNQVVVIFHNAHDYTYSSASRADGQALVRDIFGRDLSDEELGRFAGAHSGDRVILSPQAPGELCMDVKLQSPDRYAEFSVTKYRHGIWVGSINVRNFGARSAVSGSTIVQTLLTWKDFGVTRVNTMAMRSATQNGYEAWAKIGFEGDIPVFGEEGSDGRKFPLRWEAQARFGANITRVEQLMRQPGGLAWWREHGTSWWAELDLSSGSQAVQILERLQRHQAR